MVEFNLLENGNLQIVWDGDDEDKEFLSEQLEEYGSNVALTDACESQLCNGYGFVTADQLGQMSEMPLIGEDLALDDDGSYWVAGKVWGYDLYQTSCPVKVLLERGSVEFSLVLEFDHPEQFITYESV